MPLNAQSECGSASDAYRFDRAVLGHPLHDNAIARLEDGLTMQRVRANGLATEESGEYAVGDKSYLMAIGEHDRRIAMKTSIFRAWRTVIHAARKVSHLGVERAAESDIHLLKSAADPEQGHASVDARPYKAQSYRIAITVVGLVPDIRVNTETGRMHVGSRTGQQNSIHGVEKSIDVGDAWTTGEHQRESVRDFADAPKTVFPNELDLQDVMDRMGVTDNTDYWLAHFSASLHRCDST